MTPFETVELWHCDACSGDNTCGTHRCAGCGVKDYGTPPEKFTRTDQLLEALEGLVEAWGGEVERFGRKPNDTSTPTFFHGHANGYAGAAANLKSLISDLKEQGEK